MKDLNTCEEFFEKYTDALIASASLEYFGMANVEGRPTRNSIAEKEMQLNPGGYTNLVIGEMVDRYVLKFTPDIGQQTLASKYPCSTCGKKYQKASGLLKHIKQCHTTTQSVSLPPCKDYDHKYHYVTNALNLGMLVKKFTDARKLGDDDRVYRLHKFLLLHFKLNGRTKYSFEVLHHAAQVECLLTPYLSFQLRWNRSVNTKGLLDSNIELDREVEHRNKYFKEDVKGFRGKVTTKSIDRVSQASGSLNLILQAYDKEADVKKPSGRHVRANYESDVLALVEKTSQEQLFQ